MTISKNVENKTFEICAYTYKTIINTQIINLNGLFKLFS